MYPFISWSVHCLLYASINLMEHPLMHPFISWSVHCLLMYPLISWSILLCIHLYLAHDAPISFLFMLYIILMHPFTSSLFIHLIQYRAVIIGFIIISATQIITSNNRILTKITKYLFFLSIYSICLCICNCIYL